MRMQIKNLLLKSTIAAAVLLGMNVVNACTSVELTSLDHTIMMARSMEFSSDLHSNIRTYPRDYKFTTTLANGKSGMSWTSKYGYLYLDGFGVSTPVEGMNEAGLSFEALLFPGADSQYQTAASDKKSIPYIHFGDWVLGNFNNVEQLKKALAKISVTSVKLPQFDNNVFPLHFFVHDASGNGIVIEYVNGQLNVYDDNTNVLTNAPSYDWQVKNIRNYVNLTPYTPDPIVIGNMTFESTGQGSGMHGIPGDISPPSRFIKIFALKNTALTPQNATDTLNLAQHIMNNVDIPLGYVRAKQANGSDLNEWTQWVVFEDLSHKVFYYHTYSDLTLHKIDLNKINFAPKAPMLKMPLTPDPAVIVDETAAFNQTANTNSSNN